MSNGQKKNKQPKEVKKLHEGASTEGTTNKGQKNPFVKPKTDKEE